MRTFVHASQDLSVLAFQEVMGSPHGINFRTDQDLQYLIRVAELQKKLIAEEMQETLDALDAIINCLLLGQNPTKAHLRDLLDGLGDSKYVLSHCANAFDMSSDMAFRRIHTSNLTKVGPDGTVLRNEHGKVMKPDTYKPPVLEDLIP